MPSKTKAEHLIEKLIKGRALEVLMHGAEKAGRCREKANSTKVTSNEDEPGPTCQIDVIVKKDKVIVSGWIITQIR